MQEEERHGKVMILKTLRDRLSTYGKHLDFIQADWNTSVNLLYQIDFSILNMTPKSNYPTERWDVVGNFCKYLKECYV